MSEKALRDHVVALLRSRGAHCDFDASVKHLPAELRGVRPDLEPHTPWELLEHLRIAQWDILEFSRDPEFVSPEFPAGYWPESSAPPEGDAWDQSVESFRQDLETMCRLVSDPGVDLFAPLPWGQGQTVLREALLVADHNAYHLGQMVALRRRLGAWPPRS